jgi:hypothetical protein
MPITATYTYTLADFLALQSVIRSRQRFGYATLHVYAGLAIAAGIVIAAFGMATFGNRRLSFDATTISGLLTVVVIALVVIEVLMRVPFIANSSYKNQSVADQAFTFLIHDAGLTISGKDQAGEWKWSAVKAVEQYRDTIFLMVSDQQAILLPARAFTTPADYQAALALARLKVPAA